MNEVYYYGQNSCYDSTSIGFDQSQPQQYIVDHPIFNAHNDYLDSQNQLNSTLAKIMDQMTSITSLCEMACQVVQKKLEEKQHDNIFSGLPSFSTITPDEPVLSTEEPDNPLSMRDEHLDTILATKSDEFIKSGVENLIPIPSESEGIPEHMCDVLSHDNSPPLDVSDSEEESEGKPMTSQKAPSFVQTSKHVKTPRPSVKTVEHSIPVANLKIDIPISRGHSRNRNACFVSLTIGALTAVTLGGKALAFGDGLQLMCLLGGVLDLVTTVLAFLGLVTLILGTTAVIGVAALMETSLDLGFRMHVLGVAVGIEVSTCWIDGLGDFTYSAG
nr:hypothetical protein [Tanacetum cinerariifolium]